MLVGITNGDDLLVADSADVTQWVIPAATSQPCRDGWSLWRTEACDADAPGLGLVAVGRNRNYSLLPLNKVAEQNYTVLCLAFEAFAY